jgi:hypothetical protein
MKSSPQPPEAMSDIYGTQGFREVPATVLAIPSVLGYRPASDTISARQGTHLSGNDPATFLLCGSELLAQ